MSGVVVTGIGLLSPLGWGADEHVDAMATGRCGLSQVEAWRECGLRSLIGGLPPTERVTLEQERFSARRLSTLGVPSAQAALATAAALHDAGLDDTQWAGTEVGCIVGSGVGSMPPIAAGARLIERGRARRVSPFALLQSMGSSASAHLSHLFDLRGPSWTVASACASSAHAIGQASDLIRNGVCEVVVTGGTEEINELVVASFEALRTALSREHEDPTRASLPFSRGRQGLVLGGGAAILILESGEHARRRGHRPYGEVLGWAATCGPADLVQPEPTGTAAAECLERALERAGVGPDSVDYVNAHGTGTVAGDLAEARAIDRVFGGSRPYVGSTKGLSGHLLGGAGALEAALCLLALDRQLLPGMPHLAASPVDGEQLPSLRWVPEQTVQCSLQIAASNSFGFGGTNGTLVLAKENRRAP